MENTSRYKIVCRICLWLFCALCVVSCSQDETTAWDEEVDVVVRLSSPGVMVESRGVADDPKNENSTWTTEELLADGSRLYRVTLLVVDNNNRLVGFQDWNDNELRTEVSTEIKGLKSNTAYRIIAVANYSAYTYSGNKSWAGLSNFPNLTNLTLGTNVSSTITALNNYTLTDANSDRVAAKQPQPLSVVQEFTTSSGGTTEVDAELLRTYARIRIAITNRSKDFDLEVKGLRFGSASSAFGQNTESLLPVSDENIRVAEGNLSVTSGDAIVKFASLSIPCLEDGNESSEVAFDGYIYECKNENGLNYALDLKYPLPEKTYSVYVKGNSVGSGITTQKYYMIECGNGYYLSVQNHQLVAVPIDASETTFTSANAIWYITKDGNNYYFQSAENTSSYIKLSSSKVELSTKSSMLLSNDRKLYNTFTEYNYWGGSQNVSYYLSVSNGAVSAVKDNSTTQFTFYSVNIESRKDNISERTVTVPLQTIADGVSRTTSIIRRNDFFNVSLSVNYNKITEGLELEYAVQNWGTGGGNVEFN